eukprot:TRINITY_DN2254_c0_g1_i1.p1 TRINITY_DN2254_c0_g1~~TRINITY_DN2254_c0_g1_i1.p1  ORF type:complete len:315 (+),score=83.22 TRINITY_DN2254_c0_g1_i1:90-947(+)
MFKLLEYYHKVRVPAPGQLIEISYAELDMPQIELTRPTENERVGLLHNWALPLLLTLIPFKSILVLLVHVLLEETVVLVHPAHRTLSACVLGLAQLIAPFHYPWSVIPILPESMSSYLEAPCPLLTGLLQMPHPAESEESALFYNIGQKKFVSRGGAFQHSMTFPNAPALLEKVKPALKRLAKSATSLPLYHPAKQQIRESTAVTMRLQSHLELQLLNNFANHCIRDVTDAANPITVFLYESYIAEAKKSEQPFLRRFFQTQIFASHRDELLRKQDEGRARGRKR